MNLEEKSKTSQVEIGNPDGGGVHLTFDDFVLEESDGCELDFVQVARFGIGVKKQTNINFSFSTNSNCNQGVGRERQADLRQDVWISNTRPYHKPWQHDCCLPQVKSKLVC